MKRLALIAGLTLIFVSVRCQKGGFNNSELGVSMDLPKGWVQGEPKSSGFHKTEKGDCFQDMELPETERPAMGCIGIFSFAEKTFDEFIADRMKEMEISSKLASALLGLAEQHAPEAVSGLTEQIQKVAPNLPMREDITVGSKRAVKLTSDSELVRTIHYYIDAKDKVISVGIEIPMSKADKYQPLVDEMVWSMRVK